MEAEGPSEYGTRVVRIFPDYADAVIWFMHPVGYREAGISVELADRLRAWEDSSYRAVGTDRRWRSRELLRRFDREGAELARSLADEIGPDFDVEYAAFENPDEVVRLTAVAPATNPAARAAFASLAQDCRDLWDYTRRIHADPSVSFGWFTASELGELQSVRAVPPRDPDAA